MSVNKHHPMAAVTLKEHHVLSSVSQAAHVIGWKTGREAFSLSASVSHLSQGRSVDTDERQVLSPKVARAGNRTAVPIGATNLLTQASVSPPLK